MFETGSELCADWLGKRGLCTLRLAVGVMPKLGNKQVKGGLITKINVGCFFFLPAVRILVLPILAKNGCTAQGR